MHLYKIFSASRYIALIASVKFRIGGPKNGSECTSLCAPKVIQEVNFPKSFLEQLYTGWIVVVHLCFGFSLWRQMAPQQSAKFRTAFFGQFSIQSINFNLDWLKLIDWIEFRTSLRGALFEHALRCRL